MLKKTVISQKSKKVIGSLNKIVKGRGVRMEVKEGLRDSIVLPIQTYAAETLIWNESLRSRIKAVEMNY